MQLLWIAILVLSAAGITGVRIWNKKKQVKRLGIEEKKEEEEKQRGGDKLPF